MTNAEASMESHPSNHEAETEPLEQLWETQFEHCDICGFQSYYVVTVSTGKLFFCAHHFTKNKDALLEVSEDILDESAMLLAR